MKWIRLLFPLLMLCASPIAAAEVAQHVAAEPQKSEQAAPSNDPVQAALLSENSTVKPGEPFWVGVELKMHPGWDTYWQNPGDSGFPTAIEWQLPKGFHASAIEWPYPEKFSDGTLVGYGYTDSVLLLTKITPPAHYKGEKIEIGADVSWLACKDACLPGGAHLSLSLPIGKGEKGSEAARFAQVKARVPHSSLERVSAKAKEGEIALRFQPPIPAQEVQGVEFYPTKKNVIDSSAPQQMQVERGGVTLNMKAGKGGGHEMEGVLVISQKGNPEKVVMQVDAHIKEIAKAHFSRYGLTLALAFLGGMLLNVMPCVLPVIALKIFSFVKMAQERRRVILQHGMLFTFGVLLSFWALSGALLLLRAFGQSVGWGFQLQEPLFVAAMVGILFILGLSLFGVFELGTSMIALGSKAEVKKSPLVSSFLSGVLATLVATPCTGPLLGPALGAAMALPPALALAIFTAMGLGMASPYLLFSAFPQLVRFLPKPGNWMVVFKKVMGFLMMATVGWLVWVFAAQVGHIALLALLLALVVIGVAAWIYGEWGTPLKKRSTRTLASLFAALLVGVAGVGTVKAVGHHPAATQQIADASGEWAAYTPEKVAQLRAEGKAVFVDFTAKWCLICQANKVTLHSSEVMGAFHERGVVTLTADWTKRDGEITKQLEKLGRTGVPVYVLYPADASQEPLILPQNLNAKVMRDYLARLDPSSL